MIKLACFPYSLEWSQFEKNMDSYGYDWSLDSVEVPVDLIDKDEIATADHPQFPYGIYGQDYWMARISEEDSLTVFGAKTWKMYMLKINHPDYGDIEEKFLDFPIEFSQPIKYEKEVIRGYLANRLNTLHSMTYTDYMPQVKKWWIFVLKE